MGFSQTKARDYADFCENYSVTNSIALIDPNRADDFLADDFGRRWAEQNPDKAKNASAGERQAGALNLLIDTWKIPFPEFGKINFGLEMQARYGSNRGSRRKTPNSRALLNSKRRAEIWSSCPASAKSGRPFSGKRESAKRLPSLRQTPTAAHQLWLSLKRKWPRPRR
jgi:hypothetical protein